MYTKQKSDIAYLEKKMWKKATTPRMGIVKQLLDRIMAELEAVNERPKRNLEADFNLFDQVKSFEIDLIRNALYLTNYNQRMAAQMLGINNTTLNAKMKRYGIGSHAGQRV